jgi:hypothetical protein
MYPSTIEESKKYLYSYWENKPVQKLTEIVSRSTRIENELDKKFPFITRTQPLELPDKFEWVKVAVSDKDMLDKIGIFLTTYLSDKQTDSLRTVWTTDMLQWMLGKNGFMLTIMTKDSNKICGVVGLTYNRLIVCDKKENFAQPIFLCAHPSYHKKKIAKLLMDELFRQTFPTSKQGIFFTKRCVPTPFARVRYYNRPLNFSKLKNIKFIVSDADDEKKEKYFSMTIDKASYSKAEKSDLPYLVEAYKKFFDRFNIYNDYNQDDLEHLLFAPCVQSYVYKKDNKVVDFLSFYNLDLKSNGNLIHTAHVFLYTTNDTYIGNVLDNYIKITKDNEYDMLVSHDCLTLTDGLLTKERNVDEESDADEYQRSYEHQFTKSVDKTFINFFNWKCPALKTRQIGIVPVFIL